MRSIHQHFGDRLRALREEQQLKVIEMAALVGLDSSFYYSLERGDDAPSFATIMAIAKALKVDEADLFTWPDAGGLRHQLRELLRLAPNGILQELKRHLESLIPTTPTKTAAKAKRRPR